MSGPQPWEALFDAPPPASAPLPPMGLEVIAYGRPKAKGSLRHVGGGRLIEQVTGSGDWRTDMVIAARNAVALADYPPRYPLDCSVRVEATFTFPRPLSAPKTRITWPITRASGDVDKLARNAIDALVDAGVLIDDARVIDLLACKRYPGQGPDALDLPGARIRVIG